MLGDVAGGKDVRVRGHHPVVDDDAAPDVEPRLPRQPDVRLDAGRDKTQVDPELPSVRQYDALHALGTECGAARPGQYG